MQIKESAARHASLICEFTPMAAVKKVDSKANEEPAEEAQPRENRQSGHQQEAERHANDWHDWTTGRAETAMPLRFAVTQDQYANRDQHESEERADV